MCFYDRLKKGINKFPKKIHLQKDVCIKMETKLPLKNLGDYVCKIRKRKKMNQVEFYRFLFPESDAEEENIKKKMNSIEHGKGKRVNYELLIRLHEKFDVSLDYLFGFETKYPNYENKAACLYTGLNPETIKQLHNWSLYANMDIPESSTGMSVAQREEYEHKRQLITDAKWIYEIINMLFQPKYKEDLVDGISDLSVLYDIYMLSVDIPDTVYGIPYEITQKDIPWYEKAVNSVEICSDSLIFSDLMNESHIIDLSEISQRMWKDRLLKDIDIMISSIKEKDQLDNVD